MLNLFDLVTLFPPSLPGEPKGGRPAKENLVAALGVVVLPVAFLCFTMFTPVHRHLVIASSGLPVFATGVVYFLGLLFHIETRRLLTITAGTLFGCFIGAGAGTLMGIFWSVFMFNG